MYRQCFCVGYPNRGNGRVSINKKGIVYGKDRGEQVWALNIATWRMYSAKLCAGLNCQLLVGGANGGLSVSLVVAVCHAGSGSVLMMISRTLLPLKRRRWRLDEG